VSRKNSGVIWLDDIPAHWTVNYLGNLVQVAGGSTPSKENPDFWHGSIPWVSPKDMKREVVSDSEDHVTQLALRKSSLRVIPDPAVLMVIRGMILDHTVPIARTSRPVTVNQDMKALRPRAGLSVEYLSHFLRAMNEALLARVEEAGHGTKALRTDLWRKVPVLVPPEAEQHAIVSHVDRKTAAIDALIAKKERLIELLQEKRQVFITQAVTKGLNPTAPLRQTGLPWLGHVPTHWTLCRMKDVVLPVGGIQMGPFGAQLKNLVSHDTGFKLYGQENTITGDFSSGSRWLTAADFERLDCYRLLPGDVVLTRKGASIGNCRLVPEGIQPGCTDSDTIRVRFEPTRVRAEFAVLLMHEGYLEEEIQYSRRGSVLPGLNTRTIANLRVAVPPVREQDLLLTELKGQLALGDRALASTSRSVDLLREYRQALITAAVTGKIDVSTTA